MKRNWIGISVLMVLATLGSSAQAQSSDPDHPQLLQTNVIEGKASGKKQSVSYYQFTAGPGDVRITVDASTNYYSTFMDVELLSSPDFTSIGSFPAAANDSPQRTVKTISLGQTQTIILKLSTREDTSVQWLQYKIRIEGVVDLAPTAGSAAQVQPMVAPPAPIAPPEAPPASAGPTTFAAPPAEPQAIAAQAPVNVETAVVSATAGPAGVPNVATSGSLTGLLLDQLLGGGISKLPSTGILVIQLKDGTTQTFDISVVRKIFIQKVK